MRRPKSVATVDHATARQQALTLASSAGILGLLHSETSQIGAVFRDGGPLDGTSTDALDGLVGTEVGEAGPGGNFLGAGTRGNGPGGGGDSIHTGDPGHGDKRDYRGCPPGAVCSLADRKVGTLIETPTVNVIVHGTGDKELFRRVIRQHKNEVRFCYERALTKTPDLAGRLLMRFAVDANGRVLAASVDQSTISDGAVGACVSEAIRRWTFPKLDGSTIIQYPFVFAAAGS